jgi:hypothetical protein
MYIIKMITIDNFLSQISRVPLGIKDIKGLSWFDIRGNPFLTSWSKINHVDEKDFDPQTFIVHLTPFLEAVKAKHEILTRIRAQNFRDYLLICPKGSRSSSK